MDGDRPSTDAYLHVVSVQQGPKSSPTTSALGAHLIGLFLGHFSLGPIWRPGPVDVHMPDTVVIMPRAMIRLVIVNCIFAVVSGSVGTNSTWT